MNVLASNLCFKGQKTTQLHSINFDVATGQCLVISGISGSGKSLLLGLICGLVNVDSGVVTFNGLTMDDMTGDEEIQFKKRIGVIFQKPALLSNLTLKENLLLPLIQHFPQLPASERLQMVEKMCQKFELWRCGETELAGCVLSRKSSGRRRTSTVTGSRWCLDDRK